MPQSLRECFILQDFNPDRYVKDLSSQCIGADELRQQRAKIQDLADNTSALLKLNVYQNYIQFIETAKEISHLESEMYQLSQLLSEQRSLLNTLGTNQISLENNSEIEEHSYIDLKLKEETKQLIQLLENVEGAISLIETPGRICLHDGSLLELDSLDSTPLRRVHAYLFNDVLMIASWMNNTNRRGLPKYKMQVVYDLQNLAVVNIKDLGPVKFAFKLLAFPDTRIFQCATAISKKEWLEKCDHAKRLRICKENQPESSVKKCTNYLEPIVAVSQSSSIQLDIDAENLNKVEFFKPLPEWIVEFTEELDSYVAQRHYEDAYYLLKKTKRFLKNVHNISQYHGVKEKLIDKANFLVNILTKELESSVEIKSLQGGGLRSAKKVVKLLIQLNRSTQAHQLYLMLCTATLKGQLKKVKREGAIVSYVKELSAIAFSNIAEMAQDFLKIFPRHSYCTSALIVWCSNEIDFLTSHLSKQMFIPQVSLNALAECITTIRDHCEQLSQIGLDFRSQFDRQIRTPLIKILQDAKEKYIDVVKIRGAEDNFKPCNFQSVQSHKKFISELEDLGIYIPDSYDKNKHYSSLTNNTLNFSKLYIGLLEDCLNLYTSEVIIAIDEILYSILQLYMQHLQTSFIRSRLKQEKVLLQDNFNYIQNVIISRSLELYQSVTGQQFEQMLEMKKQPLSLTCPSAKPQPAPRNLIKKFSTDEYV